MIKMFMFLMIINSVMFCSMKTPISMGFIIIFQTIIISFISGMMSLNFWYTYMLFLIMIGGMLILFIYMSSLSSNLKFFFMKKNFLIKLIIIMMLMIILYLKNKNYFINLFNNIDIMNILNLEIEENFLLKISMNKMYNKPLNQMLIMLINYLLLTLFIIVKIIKINKGPLRKKYN